LTFLGVLTFSILVKFTPLMIWFNNKKEHCFSFGTQELNKIKGPYF